MNDSRRDFLEKGLVGVGVAAAGLLTARVMRRFDKPSPTQTALTPALTSDGQLIRVSADHAAHGHGDGAHTETHPHAADDPAVRTGVPGRKWVMVIDLAKCDGCKNCTVECNKMHNTPPDREWMRVFRMQDAHHTAPYWFPKPCFHCDNPPCTKVCPVGATFKRQDGIVLIDNERCIGCRFCMAACPYSTRFFNWGRPQNPSSPDSTYSPETGFPRRIGTVEKCDFCPEMAQAGTLPGCVKNCHMGALYFGDENEDAVTNSDETVRLSKLLEERAGYRYLEELGTEPRVYYLPPKNREFPGPAKKKKPQPHHTSA